MYKIDYLRASRKDAGFFVIFVVFVSLFYYSYRYPLQINSSTTSPTYSDTPFILQALKFVILYALFFWGIVRYRVFVSRKILIISVFFLFQVAVGLAKLVVAGNFEIINFVLWPILGVGFCYFPFKIRKEKYDLVVFFIFVLSFCVSIVEWILYWYYGRLPALAYYKSFSVRFGSFLDDPNGFSALTVFFLGWIAFKYDGLKLFLAVIATLVMCLFTQSVTGIAIFCFLLSFTVFSWIKKYPIPSIILFSFLVLGGIYEISVQIDKISQFYAMLFQLKFGSINDHVDINLSDLLFSDVGSLILGGSGTDFYEPGWLDIFILGGGVVFAASFVISAYFVVVLYKKFVKEPYSRAKSIYASILYLNIFFLFGNFNLPFIEIFPINFIYYFLNAAILSKEIIVI